MLSCTFNFLFFNLFFNLFFQFIFSNFFFNFFFKMYSSIYSLFSIYSKHRSANAFTSMALCMDLVMGLIYMLKCVVDFLITKKQQWRGLSWEIIIINGGVANGDQILLAIDLFIQCHLIIETRLLAFGEAQNMLIAWSGENF